MNKMECPYCDHENELDYIECNEFEYECHECGETFDVEIDYAPVITTAKIEYFDCPICGKNKKFMGIYYPIPKTLEHMDEDTYKRVCYLCRRDEYVKGLEAGIE